MSHCRPHLTSPLTSQETAETPEEGPKKASAGREEDNTGEEEGTARGEDR